MLPELDAKAQIHSRDCEESLTVSFAGHLPLNPTEEKTVDEMKLPCIPKHPSKEDYPVQWELFPYTAIDLDRVTVPNSVGVVVFRPLDNPNG